MQWTLHGALLECCCIAIMHQFEMHRAYWCLLNAVACILGWFYWEIQHCIVYNLLLHVLNHHQHIASLRSPHFLCSVSRPCRRTQHETQNETKLRKIGQKRKNTDCYLAMYWNTVCSYCVCLQYSESDWSTSQSASGNLSSTQMQNRDLGSKFV